MNNLDNTDFDKVSNFLATPKRILLTSHTNPDGDAIGSVLALYGYFKKKGHTVRAIMPDPSPSFLSWMPFHDDILVFNRNEEECLKAISEAEILFSIDYNSLTRLSKASIPARESKAVKILIDHHTNPSADFKWQISVPGISSTAQLVYEFIVKSGDKFLIDKNIAECIYSGIITDTGSFSYSCNDEKTYRIVADLVKIGIDGEHIHRLIYDTFSENRIRLLGYSISRKLVVIPEFHASYIALTKEELDRYHHETGDTEDIVNWGLSIRDINFAGLFYEKEDMVKVSLRSKGSFPVNEIARKFFNGGGHRNAAGANSFISLDETIRIFTNLLPLYKSQLEKVY